MIETRKLVEEIEAFLLVAQMAETTFGRKSVNDGKLLSRLRAGGSVNLEKAAQIRRFILDASAPASVPRPVPSPEAVP